MDFRYEIQDTLRGKGINPIESNRFIFGLATIGLLIGKDKLEEIGHDILAISDKMRFTNEVFSNITDEEDKNIARLAFMMFPSIWDMKYFSLIIDIVLDFDLRHIVLDLSIYDYTMGKERECPLTNIPWVSKLVIEILKLHGGKTLYNVDCGTSEFIVGMLKNAEIERAIGYTYSEENYIISQIKAYFLDKKFDVKVTNLFTDALEDNEKVDMAYNAYPLMLRYEREEIIPMIKNWTFPFDYSRKYSANLLWIVNSLQCVKPDGIVVAFVPNGVLFNDIDKDIRKFLVENNYIDSIISFPSGIIPFTGVASSLIILQKGKTTKNIRMIDATEIYHRQRRYSLFEEEDIAKILDLYKSPDDSDEAFCVQYEDIVSNNYHLGIGKYIETGYSILNPCVLETVTKSIFRGYQIKASEYDKISVMGIDDTEYRIINVSDIRTDGYVEKDLQAVVVNDTRKFDKYCVEDGDIIITAKNTTIKTAVYREVEDYKAILTGNLIAIRPNQKKVNPYYLKAFLDSEIGEALLKSIQTGTTVFSISPNSLRELVISLPEMELQMEIADEYIKTVNEIENLLLQYNEKSAYLKRIYKNKTNR